MVETRGCEESAWDELEGCQENPELWPLMQVAGHFGFDYSNFS